MSFGANSGNECIEYLNEYKDCSKIIIDLRDNTGGYETAVQEIAGLFLGKDKVVMHKITLLRKRIQIIQFLMHTMIILRIL